MEESGPITIDDLEGLMAELRMIARGLLQKEGAADSIRPTALVISGLRRYKLSDQDWSEVRWENRAHFFASAHRMMRRALIDHARKRNAQRRPRLENGDEADLDFYNLPNCAEHAPDRVVALEEALAWLSVEREDLAIIVQHHYFSGLTVRETAEILEVSEPTVKRRLAESRLILEKKIRSLSPPTPQAPTDAP